MLTHLNKHFFLLILSATVGALAGCQMATPTAEIAAVELTKSDPITAIASITLRPTDAATMTPGVTQTTTPEAASANVPTQSPKPATPTATVSPASHESVSQVAYAASDCSDKYPCNDDFDAWEARLLVPSKFEAAVFSRIDDFPTSLTFGPGGDLFVAGYTGAIYRIDESGEASVYVEGFSVPTGIAFEPDTERLYVSSRVRNENVGGEGKISVVSSGEISTLFAGLPCCYLGMHGPNGIAFGPDGFGYVGVGGRADHGEILVEPDVGEQDELEPFEAAILRFSPDGETVEVYARGFRNPYDIAWDGDGRLFATDNGRDPDPVTGYAAPDELHQVVPGGEHGYPYYECSNCFGIPDGLEVIEPVLELMPHAAATGLVAYTHDSRPAYFNDVFIVTWSAFEGAQNVIRYSPDTGQSSVFATGFAQPIDITVGPDGNIYVADYATGLIVRIAFLD